MKLFYKIIFKYIIAPLFAIVFIGKPMFLIRILTKIIHFKEPIKQFELYNILLVFCIIGSIYFLVLKINEENSILFSLRSGSDSLARIDDRIGLNFSHERNCLIFLNCIAMLLSVQKMTERYFRIDNKEKEINEKKKKINQNIKSEVDKKND